MKGGHDVGEVEPSAFGFGGKKSQHRIRFNLALSSG